MTTADHRLLTALEALLSSVQQDAKECLLLPIDALEQRLTTFAQLLSECHSALSAATLDDDSRDRVRVLAAALNHHLKVYRAVILAGLRSTNALLQATAPSSEQGSAGFGG